MTMSDRVAVIVDGRVEQVGTPSEIYARPATPYVAAFLGSANLYDAVVISSEGDQVSVDVRGHRLVATCAEPCADGEAVTVMIRPERVAINESTGVDGVPNALTGVVSRLTYRGAHTMVTLVCDDLNLEAEVANVHGEPPAWLDPGRSVRVTLSPAALRVMPRQAVAAVE
jgi:spermidine/putrescine transport system ATP-binding protein